MKLQCSSGSGLWCRIRELRGDFAFAAVNNANNWRTLRCERRIITARLNPSREMHIVPTGNHVNENVEDTLRTKRSFLYQVLRLVQNPHFNCSYFQGEHENESHMSNWSNAITQCLRVNVVSRSASLWLPLSIQPWVGQCLPFDPVGWSIIVQRRLYVEGQKIDTCVKIDAN